MAVIENEGKILMRKKPEGSKPYDETWYIFGVELSEGADPTESLVNYLKDEIGISVSIEKTIGWGSEIKEDHDGIVKQYVYLDTLCRYLSGEAKIPANCEKVEWVEKGNLSNYDIVPPSVELFKRIGYL